MALTKICTKESLWFSSSSIAIYNVVNCDSNLVRWKLKDSYLCKYCENSITVNTDTITLH